jgi:hypothetical protein
MSGTLLIEAKRLAARWCVWRGSFQEPVVHLYCYGRLSVIDTSAVIAVVTNESHKPALIRLTEGVELLSPSSLPVEVGTLPCSKRSPVLTVDRGLRDAARRAGVEVLEVAP